MTAISDIAISLTSISDIVTNVTAISDSAIIFTAISVIATTFTAISDIAITFTAISDIEANIGQPSIWSRQYRVETMQHRSYDAGMQYRRSGQHIIFFGKTLLYKYNTISANSLVAALCRS